MNPSILHFSRIGSFFKLALFAGATVVCFYGAYDLIGLKPEPVRQIVLPGGLELPAPTPHQDPLAPIRALVLLVGGCFGIFYIFRYGLRLFAREVAVKIENGCLHFHSSFAIAPEKWPLADIAITLFDRADKIPRTDGEAFMQGYAFTTARAAKFGARLRHVLYVQHRSGETISLVDNDFDGGASQLSRFANYLEQMRLSHIRVANR